MNKQVKNLYVVISNNRVLNASTSLTDFVRTAGELYPKVKSRSYYQKKFKNQIVIKHVDNLGQEYYFQKVK